MRYTPRINEAIALASRLHRNQVRNDSGKTPYISHLVSVACIIGSVTEDEDIIIAGLMHDSLEDVPHYSYDDLVRDCGERVASIVRHVTEPLDANKASDEQMPWLERKEAYMNVLRDGGVESALVSSADKIHNTENFLQSAQEEGEMFMMKFGSSVRNRLWFHEQVLAIVSEKLGHEHPLVKHFESATVSFRAFVGN